MKAMAKIKGPTINGCPRVWKAKFFKYYQLPNNKGSFNVNQYGSHSYNFAMITSFHD